MSSPSRVLDPAFAFDFGLDQVAVFRASSQPLRDGLQSHPDIAAYESLPPLHWTRSL